MFAAQIRHLCPMERSFSHFLDKQQRGTPCRKHHYTKEHHLPSTKSWLNISPANGGSKRNSFYILHPLLPLPLPFIPEFSTLGQLSKGKNSNSATVKIVFLLHKLPPESLHLPRHSQKLNSFSTPILILNLGNYIVTCILELIWNKGYYFVFLLLPKSRMSNWPKKKKNLLWLLLLLLLWH